MTAAFVLVLLRLSAPAPAPGEACLLAGVDRARTLSSTCLSCHDGSAGPAAPLRGRGVHPVAVTYAAARAEVAIRRVGPLDPAVVLPAGRVECVSCHAGDGEGPHRTVRSFAALCTGCHDK